MVSNVEGVLNGLCLIKVETLQRTRLLEICAWVSSLARSKPKSCCSCRFLLNYAIAGLSYLTSGVFTFSSHDLPVVFLPVFNDATSLHLAGIKQWSWSRLLELSCKVGKSAKRLTAGGSASHLTAGDFWRSEKHTGLTDKCHITPWRDLLWNLGLALFPEHRDMWHIVV